MTSESDFCPTWTSPPGDTIRDILAERNLSISAFAQEMGQALTEIDDLLQGRSSITIRTARRLARVLGASVEFWMSRDFQYRETISRGRDDDTRWLSALPLRDMVKFGWIRPSTPSEELGECLNFFSVPSVNAWRSKYANVEQLAAFRTSSSFESRPASVAAWLRQGEIEGAAIECEPWSRDKFATCLSTVRSLTRQKDPSIFLPLLKKLCAASGVAFVVVRYPHGCRASGAARFLTPTKALLQCSFRYLSDDQFWFTFFHEAGHLLLHGESGLFVDGIGERESSEEVEANRFAADVLVPPESRAQLDTMPLTPKELIRFARGIGVSPGVLVGQLQYDGKVRRDRLNSLKRRFTWTQ